MGARTGCDDDTLRRQYKVLVIDEIHPDKRPPNWLPEYKEPFNRIRYAYEILTTPSMRRRYDTAREDHFRTLFNKTKLQTGIELQWLPWMAFQENALLRAEVIRARKFNIAGREREQETDESGGDGGPAPPPPGPTRQERERGQETDEAGGGGGPAPPPPGPTPQEVARLVIGAAAAPTLAQGVNYGPFALAKTLRTLLGFGPTDGVVIWLYSIKVTSLNQLLNMIPTDFTDPPPQYSHSNGCNEIIHPVSFIETREIRKLIAFNNVNYNHNGGHLVDLEACDLNMYQAFTPHYDPNLEYPTLPQVAQREASEQQKRQREAQQCQWEQQRNHQAKSPPEKEAPHEARKEAAERQRQLAEAQQRRWDQQRNQQVRETRKKEGANAQSGGDKAPTRWGGGDCPQSTPQERARLNIGDAAAPTVKIVPGWDRKHWAPSVFGHIYTTILGLAPDSSISQYIEQNFPDPFELFLSVDINHFQKGLMYLDRSEVPHIRREVPFREVNKIKIFIAFIATNNSFNGNETVDCTAVTKRMYRTFRNSLYNPSVDYNLVRSMAWQE